MNKRGDDASFVSNKHNKCVPPPVCSTINIAKHGWRDECEACDCNGRGERARKKVTERFLNKGYAVTVHYRSDIKAVEALKEMYRGCHERLHFVQGDVTKKEDLIRIVDEAVVKFGRIDYLIHNAGITYLSEKS